MDVKSAIALAKNPMHHKRSKHIDIKYHWLREHTGTRTAPSTWSTVVLKIEIVADMMTKALAFDLHTRHAKIAQAMARSKGGFLVV